MLSIPILTELLVLIWRLFIIKEFKEVLDLLLLLCFLLRWVVRGERIRRLNRLGFWECLAGILRGRHVLIGLLLGCQVLLLLILRLLWLILLTRVAIVVLLLVRILHGLWLFLLLILVLLLVRIIHAVCLGLLLLLLPTAQV